MRYVSNPSADIMRPNVRPTELGVRVDADLNVFRARNKIIPTMDNNYEVRVYENEWKRQYNVLF